MVPSSSSKTSPTSPSCLLLSSHLQWGDQELVIRMEGEEECAKEDRKAQGPLPATASRFESGEGRGCQGLSNIFPVA